MCLIPQTEATLAHTIAIIPAFITFLYLPYVVFSKVHSLEVRTPDGFEQDHR